MFRFLLQENAIVLTPQIESFKKIVINAFMQLQNILNEISIIPKMP